MKIKSLIYGMIGFLTLNGLTSCDSDQRPQRYTINSLSNPSSADSLMYYFGQMCAIKYWRDAETDTFLRNPDARKEYIAGVQDAMKALGRSEAYLIGLLDGADHAENIATYSKNYGLKFDPNILIKSMRATIANDSMPNLATVRHDFYALRNNMEMNRDVRDEKMAYAALTTEAEKEGMTKVTDDLWRKVLVEGAGEKVVRGNHVQLAMQLTTLSGHKIPLTLPNEMIIGTRLVSTVFTDAFLTMRTGERCRFLTTALALFGTHASQMGLHPEDILELTITILGEMADRNSEANPADLPE